MIFFADRQRDLLEKAVFRENPAPTDNPGRGWYHIYTYALGAGEAFPHPTAYENETLALALFDIGAYRERELDDGALETMQEILAEFVKNKIEMIVRVTYDTQGKGMEREPSSFSLVQRHMRQIAPVLAGYGEDILVHQGLFIGSWGEMHSSRYLGKEHLRQLTALFTRETGGRVRLAFRRPVQLRMVVKKGHAEGNIGFFNDAILASKSHMGTFGEGDCRNAGWEDPWRPEDEIAFMEPMLQAVPMGGEAVWAHRPLKTEETIRQLRELQVTYLNCVHDEARLQQWRETAWEGGSLYDYIGARLGYCFVLREAGLLDLRGGSFGLKLRIENIGFACIYEETAVRLYIGTDGTPGGSAFLTELPCGLRDIPGGQQGEIVLKIEKKKLPEGAALYMKCKRSRDGREIRFANEYTEEKLFLGRRKN